MFSFCLQLKSFHNELLTQLEQKVELDSRYLSVSYGLVESSSTSAGRVALRLPSLPPGSPLRGGSAQTLLVPLVTEGSLPTTQNSISPVSGPGSPCLLLGTHFSRSLGRGCLFLPSRGRGSGSALALSCTSRLR